VWGYLENDPEANISGRQGVGLVRSALDSGFDGIVVIAT